MWPAGRASSSPPAVFSYQGGLSIAAPGLVLHFLIASTAPVYYAVSCRFLFLIDRALLSGILYGAAVHFFMTFIVIPLSAIGQRPIFLPSFLALLVIHMVVVGPSISLTIRCLSE